MANWDVYLYTRGFGSIDSQRSRRHISKLLTYPLTIGTVLHENSPYTLRNRRLLPEGLRSLFGKSPHPHPQPCVANCLRGPRRSTTLAHTHEPLSCSPPPSASPP